ncbi:MAG: hypothetical protein E2598_12590, partial [Sphingobium sp.]|nr:hypothetical protein [Sphingobium sp.]
MGLNLSHQGLPEGCDKSDLLRLLDGLGKQGLSVSATAFKLLRYYVWRSRKEDYHAGRICGLWEKVCDVAMHLDLSPRAINGAERELEAAGYVQRTTGGNGARYGRRQGGAIVSMAGVSLAPLIGCYDDLSASLEARMLHRQAMEICRTEIHHLRRLIRDHGDTDLCEQSDAVARHGRVSRIGRQEHLEEIRDALKAILALIGGMSGALETSD